MVGSSAGTARCRSRRYSPSWLTCARRHGESTFGTSPSIGQPFTYSSFSLRDIPWPTGQRDCRRLHDQSLAYLSRPTLTIVLHAMRRAGRLASLRCRWSPVRVHRRSYSIRAKLTTRIPGDVVNPANKTTAIQPARPPSQQRRDPSLNSTFVQQIELTTPHIPLPIGDTAGFPY